MAAKCFNSLDTNSILVSYRGDMNVASHLVQKLNIINNKFPNIFDSWLSTKYCHILLQAFV